MLIEGTVPISRKSKTSKTSVVNMKNFKISGTYTYHRIENNKCKLNRILSMEYYDVGFRIIIFGHKNPRLPVLVDDLGINNVVCYTWSRILLKINLVEFSVNCREINSITCTTTVHADTHKSTTAKKQLNFPTSDINF
jgi:hypothetical protein